MSRFHIHISVDDLQKNIAFYSAVFGIEPGIIKVDYAKWTLENPKLNFAISTHGNKKGLDHVGLQADTDGELKQIRQRLELAGVKGMAQENTTCCYAKSDKYWIEDPQGIAWESFHTLDDAPVCSESIKTESAACCTPDFSGCCN